MRGLREITNVVRHGWFFHVLFQQGQICKSLDKILRSCEVRNLPVKPSLLVIKVPSKTRYCFQFSTCHLKEAEIILPKSPVKCNLCPTLHYMPSCWWTKSGWQAYFWKCFFFFFFPTFAMKGNTERIIECQSWKNHPIIPTPSLFHR